MSETKFAATVRRSKPSDPTDFMLIIQDDGSSSFVLIGIGPKASLPAHFYKDGDRLEGTTNDGKRTWTKIVRKGVILAESSELTSAGKKAVEDYNRELVK